MRFSFGTAWLKKSKFLLVFVTLFFLGVSPGLRAELSNSFYHYRIENIKGTLKDTEGNPLEGVTIVVVGKKESAVSDRNGEFTINASIGDVLEFTSVGFTALKHSVQSTNAISLVLEKTSATMDEVIIVGYGKQKKINATGAVATLNAEDIQDRPVGRITQALQGMVGNLNITANTSGGAPNATQSINIRGYTGFGESGSPLIVIDGIQGGNINSLNPNDIESISVIKDAASAAIYGSSAPNGVLLITTKQGNKSGSPKITYNNIIEGASPIGLPKMMNSYDFATIYNEALENAGRSPFFGSEVLQRIQDYIAGNITTETVLNTSRGTWAEWEDGSNANNDFFKIYFKDIVWNQQHNLNLSGGSKNSTYFVGLGYNGRQGLYNYGDDLYRRFNIRANLTTDVTKWLTFSIRSTLSREFFNTPNTYAGKTGGNYMHQIGRKWPVVPLFNPDGHYSDPSDVLLHLEGGRNKQTTDRAILTGEVTLKLAKGWTTVANYTYNAAFFNQDFHTKSVMGYRPNGNQYIITGNPNGFSRYNERLEYQVANIYSQYQRNFGRHNISVLAGFMSDLDQFVSYNASVNQLYSDNIPSLSTAYGTAPSVSDGVRKLASVGYFGRINYNFDEKYLLELNGRYDATSRFLPGFRWEFYPGISAGWNVDKESFFDFVKPVLNTFKVRGSYGLVGNQSSTFGTNMYPFYPSLGLVSPTSSNWLFGGGQQAYVTPPALVNPSLTWITTAQLNVGADFGLLNNRLQATFDWFIRKSDDFATTGAALPAVLGTGVPLTNNAGMQTKGFELSIGWRDRIGSDIRYGVRAILSDFQSKITKFENNPNGSLSNYYVGLNQGEIWGYQTVGLFQSAADVTNAPSQTRIFNGQWTPGDVQYADLNNDREINFGTRTLDDHGDLTIIGNTTMRYSYSFLGDINWKNFDFSLFIQGVGKRDAWIGSNYFWGINGDEWQSNLYTTQYDRWTSANPNGYFPKYYMSGEMGKNMQTQTRYLQNAAYLRIKNVQLGYSLPKQLLSKAGIGRARVFVSIENLATFTKMVKTVDPELFFSDAKNYPLQRTYAFGINVEL